MSFKASTVTTPLEMFRYPPTPLSLQGMPVSGNASEAQLIAMLQSMVRTLTTAVSDLAREVERMDSELAQLQT